jgi:hypothetical protein
VEALAMACIACSVNSSPRAIRAMVKLQKLVFHNYGIIEQEIE